MVHKGTTDFEIKEWNDYVDTQWDTAYNNAFAVLEFRQFITSDIHTFLNLDFHTSQAADVDRTWEDLHNRIQYFHKKTTLHENVKMTGLFWYFNDSTFEDQNTVHTWAWPKHFTDKNGYHGLADEHALDIITAFHAKTEQLVALAKDLTWLSFPRWKQHWNGEENDYWSSNQSKYPKIYTQSHYVIPRPVTHGIND